ncbi:hypothetical protein [Rheinheimera sp. MM224]|uniref:hypothetical protein n=1 Tax=Rheinheimera sp. MM224 TaxID=3019969 RepID=UPI0021F8B390|nr:hypothetical protein [Rheinheimera sp. MM224]CAI3791913.1 hypothetical protein JAMGFMIE_00427 [Rheinheimera sp. MM224]
MAFVWIGKIKKHPLFITVFYLAFITLFGQFIWQLVQLDLEAAPSLEETKTEFFNVLASAHDWHPVNELKSKNQLTIKNVRQKFMINQSFAQTDSYFEKILSTNGWRKKILNPMTLELRKSFTVSQNLMRLLKYIQSLNLRFSFIFGLCGIRLLQ